MARASNKCDTDKISKPNPLIFAVVWLLSVLGGVGEAAAVETLVDRIVAEVNGDIITFSDIMKKLKRGNVVEVAAFPAQKTDKPFTIALQDEINKIIVIQKVEEAGIEMSDDKVEAEIDSFLQKRNSSRESLMAALSQEGLTYEQYFDDFRKSLYIKHFQGRFIVPAVKITEKDIELHYFRMMGAAPSGVKLKLRNILIGVNDEATQEIKEAKQKIIDTVMNKLNDGESFEELAKVYSEIPGASENGGFFGDVELGSLAPMIKQAVEKLEVKEFSQPVKTPNGYYIFFLESKILSDSSDFQNQKRQVEYDLRTREMERETVRWIENQRSLSKIRIIK